MFTFNQLESLHIPYEKSHFKKGGKIHDIYFCPYHPTKGIGKYRKKSKDRKPNNGMIEKAVRKWNIDRSKSFMIGDNRVDFFYVQKNQKLNFIIKKE